jgi:dienelactone hydrolase
MKPAFVTPAVVMWEYGAPEVLTLSEVVLGFCIGGPLIWNLIRRAPDPIRQGI